MPPVPQEMPVRQEAEPSSDGDRVVISGMSGLYPQSRSVKDLSDILYNKKNPIKPNSARWKYSHPEVAQCTGMVPGLERFDAQFFKVHYRLGNAMDSMSRKVLEQSYQAIYDAGVSPEQLSGKKVGVYIGTCFSETEKACFYVASSRTGFGIAGCNKSMFANRISYWLNAKGPSVSIDEACCSSLAALEQAYLAIKRGECESAIVGGANLCLHPQSSLHYSRIITLCTDGKTKSFDQNADGCAKSEAINVLFIQKARDALRIYGEVLHIKSEFTAIVNTETGPKYGFYREPKVMANFLKSFYEESGVPPNAVEYVEAFGSAVSDADKVELEVIDEIFCKDREDPLLVGSVMSNIGYSEAASGISAITKVLLGYHKGQLAGNMHCETPRQDVEAVRKGRLQILTDNTRFRCSYAAVNGISVTGVNAHVLLHGHYKPKDIRRYKCDIPRLVTISGRHESAVKKIIEDLKSRPIDPEELALLHNVYKTKITGHMARGFVLLDIKTDSTVSLHEKVDYFNDSKRPLWFVYSGMGSQWAGMGAQLMRIPIFAAAIERCHQALAPKGINIVDIITSSDKTTFDNILHSFVGIAAIQIGLTDVLRDLGIVPDKIIGHSVGELGCAYADGCLSAEEMILSSYSRGLVSVQTPFIRGSMAAVGLGYQQISKMCPPEVEVACHNSSESSTISGPADIMREFVGSLTAKGIFAKEVPCSNIAYHSRYIAEAGPALLKCLKEVIKTPRARSERWVSTSIPQHRWNESIAKLSSAEYHTNNLLSSVLFEETAALIPPNAVLVEIAPHGLLQAILKRSLPESCCNIALTRRGHPDNAYLVLEAVGKLYMEGYTPKVEALYPKVEFPVSSSTPMLSHTVEWEHNEKWTVPLYVSAHRQMAASCKFILSVYDEENSYLRGHVLKGKTLYPFAAALVAVWDTLSMFMNVPKKEIPVEFRDVHLFVQPTMHDQRQLRLSVSLHRGTGRFEVMDDDSKVAIGFIVSKSTQKFINIETNDVMDLRCDDVYTLLSNRDYSYSGEFRSIYGVNSTITEALMLWRENWVTLLDGLLQLNALRHTHEGVSVAKHIGSLCIDVSEHMKFQIDMDGDTVMKTEISDVYHYTRCGGILMEHLKLRDLPLEAEGNFAVKSLQFVPRFSNNLDLVSSLHVFLQIVAENVNRNYINIASLITSNNEAEIFIQIRNVLKDINNINFNYEEINIKDVLDSKDNFLSAIDLVLVCGLSTDDKICQLLYKTLKRDSFVVSEEDIAKRIRPSAIYRKMSVGGGLQLVRWRLSEAPSNRAAVSVCTASDISLLAATRAALQPRAHLLVLAPQPPPDGLTDLIRTWRTEPTRNQISLVVMDSKSADEPMDTNIELAFNIWNKGKWGGEYHVPLPETYDNATTAMLQSARIGDINSLHWVQAIDNPEDGVNVTVHYAALNTVDALKASGLIPFGIENDPTSSGYGMDFSGVTQSGCRVMGVARGACRNQVRAAPELLWPVPDHWTLQDAATVPWPYLSAFYCFLRTESHVRLMEISQVKSLLVHGGAGALGQAAISIGLGLGYEVFTTVSDVAKKQFLLRLFPQIKEQNIGNSRDNTFGDLVLRATNGKGCHIVINTIRGDMKNISLQCCSDSGTTYDMCQLSHQENYMFPMSYLSRERSYVSLDLSSVIKNWVIEDIKMLQAMLSAGIAGGYVRPLSRVWYWAGAAPRAVRLLAGGAHRGRVLLRLHDATLRALPTVSCKPDEVHLIIICDQSSLGLHLADRLISRGARKLHMHCASPPRYLGYKIRSWQKRGASAGVSSEELNDEGISALIENVNSLGTLGGIFIIANTNDKNGGNFLSILNKLDVISRNLCSFLRYFAVISSDMSGMHTCVDRVNNGYPATLLNLNLKETSVSGGAREWSACWSRGVVSAAERALVSARAALVAHHRPALAPHAPLHRQLAAVADILIPDYSSETATLESFGVQNDKVERIRNFLEMSFNLALNEEDIKALTMQRIREIEDTIIPKEFKGVKGLETFYSHVDPDELLATTEIVFLPTHTSNTSIRDDEFDVTLTYLCIVPGLEGLHNRFKHLCERLKLPAFVLQPGLDRPNESIQEMAKKYAQVLIKKIGLKNNFYILGYEWGVPVALEVASILEGQGMVGTVFCVGAMPDGLKVMLEEKLSKYKTEEELENGVLEHMFKLMTGDECSGLEEVLRGCRTWGKKVDVCVRTLLGRVSHSAQYARALMQAALGRIQQARRYTAALQPLRSRLVLLRSSGAPPPRPPHPARVHELAAPLAHAARDTRCAAILNSYLDPALIDKFNNMNLCDTYLLNADTFMTSSTDIESVEIDLS